MLSLPSWLQPILTAITGKASPVERPRWRWTPAGRMTLSLVSFLGAVALGASAVHQGGAMLLLLPLAWLFVVGNARIFQTGIVHHASHRMLLQNRAWNDLVGELFSLSIWIQSLAAYRKDHGPHHAATAGEKDEDIAFLAAVGGLRPGVPVRTYWRHFWLTMFSPRFHGEYLLIRLQANFVEVAPFRRLASILFAIVLIGIGLAGYWPELLFAYLLPVFFLVQMSAWAGLLGLHQWVPASSAANRLEALASLTSARFIGEAAPSPGLKGSAAWAAWALWAGRMIFIHLPARLAVVPGDLPSHDWHHFHPNTRNWANAAYARRDDLLSKSPKAPLYTELWGVLPSINATFARFAELPSDAVFGRPLSYGERSDAFLAM